MLESEETVKKVRSKTPQKPGRQLAANLSESD